MDAIRIQYRKTKIGDMVFGAFKGKLCLADFKYRRTRAGIDRRIQNGLGAEMAEGEDEVAKTAADQIEEFLAGGRREFDLPLLPVGSDFQRDAWERLRKVPYGSTSTYSKIAAEIGRKTAVRAVAAANGANALALIIPCHRVIASDGSLTGYGGGLPVKKRLLELERRGAPAPPGTPD